MVDNVDNWLIQVQTTTCNAPTRDYVFPKSHYRRSLSQISPLAIVSLELYLFPGAVFQRSGQCASIIDLPVVVLIKVLVSSYLSNDIMFLSPIHI